MYSMIARFFQEALFSLVWTIEIEIEIGIAIERQF